MVTTNSIKKILLIEDDSHSIVLVEQLLLHQKCEIHIAMDGLSALQEFEKQEFDFLIIDWLLPYHNGDDLLLKFDHILRKNSKPGKLRLLDFVVFSSLNIKDINVPKLIHLNNCGFISKLDTPMEKYHALKRLIRLENVA